MATFERRNALRIRCAGFSADEVGAFRSLLGLLDQYLKQAWQIVDAGEADLVLQNLDAQTALTSIGTARVVGCALKPRAHPSGTIHRPLRAAEILSVLNEHRGGFESRTPPAEGIAWSYRLSCWPLDFVDWPKESWRVMAIMTPIARTVDEITQRSGLSASEIEHCIARLHSASLVERFAERRTPQKSTRSNSSVWRGLARTVGRVLGFAS